MCSGKSGLFPKTCRNTARDKWRKSSESLFASVKLVDWIVLRNGQAGAIGGRAILEVLGAIPERLIIGVDLRNDEDIAYDAVHGVFK